jgi:hypothetical protein
VYQRILPDLFRTWPLMIFRLRSDHAQTRSDPLGTDRVRIDDPEVEGFCSELRRFRDSTAN